MQTVFFTDLDGVNVEKLSVPKTEEFFMRDKIVKRSDRNGVRYYTLDYVSFDSSTYREREII